MKLRICSIQLIIFTLIEYGFTARYNQEWVRRWKQAFLSKIEAFYEVDSDLGFAGCFQLLLQIDVKVVIFDNRVYSKLSKSTSVTKLFELFERLCCIIKVLQLFPIEIKGFIGRHDHLGFVGSFNNLVELLKVFLY